MLKQMSISRISSRGIPSLEIKKSLEDEQILLLPKDPNDNKNLILK